MFFDPDNTMFYMIAGIVIITASLMLHQFKRRRLELERHAKRRAALEAAKEALRSFDGQSDEFPPPIWQYYGANTHR